MRRALLLAVLCASGCQFQPDLSRFAPCGENDLCATAHTCVLPERRCIPDCLGEGCETDTPRDGGPDAGEPLSLATAGLDIGIELQPFTFVLSADGGTPPYRFRATTALPAGMSLSDAGLFTGAPHDAGIYALTPEVEDSATPPARQSVELTWEVRPLLRLAGPRTLSDAVVAVEYGDAVSSTGGVPPYVYALVDGGLPDGLVLASDGGVTGTPDASTGTWAFELRVTDSATPPQQAELAVTLTVEGYNPLQALEIQTRALPEGRLGQPYEYRLQAHGGVPPYQWVITNLPDGLVNSGPVISGVPGQRVSTRNISVQVIDSALTSAEDVASFPLTVR